MTESPHNLKAAHYDAALRMVRYLKETNVKEISENDGIGIIGDYWNRVRSMMETSGILRHFPRQQHGKYAVCDDDILDTFSGWCEISRQACSEREKDRRRQLLLNWLSFGLSIIAILISIAALWLQYNHER